MRLGKKQVLTVVKKVDFGVYLGSDVEKVLLPKKQVPAGIELGDPIEVFLYKDSNDRLIATTNQPKIELGELAVLEVKDTGKFGAFLDWGLEKDLFLPFKQQTKKVQKGDKCLVFLYIDKSERLCASMKVYDTLRKDSPYQRNDEVEGIVYDIIDKFGAFVAVDNQFTALIPRREVSEDLEIGQVVHARIAAVKADGKLELSIRDKIPMQMNKDAEIILKKMKKNGGILPFTDKADSEIIQKEFNMSKNAFKRAIGRLLKEKKVEIREKSIAIINR